MKVINRTHHSNRNATPGSSIWAFTAGLLTGGGDSHFISRPDYVCPHIMVKGSGTVKTKYGATSIGVGDMFCLMPGTQVEYFEDANDPWEFFWIHLTGEDDIDFAKACGFDVCRPWFRPPKPEPIIECFQEIHARLGDLRELKPYYVVSLLYQIADLCRSPREANKGQKVFHRNLVEQAILLIDAQLHTGVNISELSAMLSVNRTTLFHAFKAIRQESPVAYLRSARIRRAKKLLRNTDFNLELVAQSSGFSNVKYFFKTFKEFEKIGPSQWRRQF